MLLAERPPTRAWYPRPVADDQEQTEGEDRDEAASRARFEAELLGLADDVWRVARRLMRTQVEAEDLVQEAYVRALRSWKSYQEGTNLRAWVLRIVHNLAIDNARKRKRTPDVDPLEEGDYYLYNRLGETGGLDTSSAEIEALLERLSDTPVLEALQDLPENFRTVVVLVDLLDFSYQEAADTLEIPIGTVMSRLHRGRRILKRVAADLASGEAREEAEVA